MLNEKLLQKISRRERIQVTSGTHEYVSLSLLSVYLLSSASALVYLGVAYGFTWKWFLCTLLVSFVFIPLYKLCFKLADISIKGDVVLINQLFKPCKVTSIKSVRQIRTRKFLNYSLTSLTYYLDGNKGKIILFKHSNRPGSEPEVIIRHIRQVA